MRIGRKKKYFLYLKGPKLIGVQWQDGKLQKVLDTSLDHIVMDYKIAGGEAILIMDKEELQHQIVPVPAQGKFSLKKMIEHEVESLIGSSPSDLVYDWRMIGTSQEEGMSQTLYLLAVHNRLEITPLLQKLSLLGLKVTKIISPLDLLIEKGRRLQIKGGSGLMVFEEPFVHFLFFRDGTYGFQRTFELRGEGVQKDFLLEIQRSFFYTKQKFKIPIERVSVLLAPEWLKGDMRTQLQETLGVSIDFISPSLKDLEFPEIKLLNILINDLAILPSLLNLLPSEILREIGTRKLAWALTFTEIVLLGLALIWTYNNQESWKSDRSLFQIRDQQLKSIQANLQTQQEKIVFWERMNEETSTVKEYLKQKENLYLYLEGLPFLIPENVHLESISWGTGSANQPIRPTTPPSNLGQPGQNNVITLSGMVDSLSPDEKYSLFFQFLNNLKSSLFVEKADFQTEELLTEGLFQINIYIKKIEPGSGAN